jgi:hypothetical protein
MPAKMTQKRTKPSWAVYEQQVFELFKQHFPAARIRKNVRVRGRFSKRKRQIDILMTETTPAGILKSVIDTKFFKRKVDVKAVEGLEGFVADVDAQKGILIKSRGYSQAALKRAFYGPAVPGIRERCASSGRNSSVFELIWTVDPQASRLQ